MQVQRGLALFGLTIVVLLSLIHATHGAGYVTFAYEPVPVRPALFGMNFNFWVEPQQYALNVWPENPTGANLSLPYDNPELTGFLKNIQSTGSRFPGGTLSSFWNVAPDSNCFIYTGNTLCATLVQIGSQTRCTSYTPYNNSIVKAYPTNYFSLLHYGSAMHNASYQWTYVANLASSPPEDIIAAIDLICADNNPACPTYLELGNEYYLTTFYPSTFPNSSVYAAKCQQVYQAVGHYFNGNVAAVGDFQSYVSNNQSNPDVMWNKGLLGLKGTAYDSLTVHTYTLSSTNFGNAKNPEWSWYTLMLAWPESNLRVAADKHRTQFPGVNLWLTEFNFATALTDTQHPDAPGVFATHQVRQPSHGLFIACFYLTMLAYPDVFSKADLFDSLRDQLLNSYVVNATGYYAYAPGQIFSHLSHIMKNHDNYTYLNMNGVDNIPPLSWYNSYSGNMSALQGAAFLSETKLTYVIMNRVNYSIDLNLTTSTGLTQLVTYTYNGTETIGNNTVQPPIGLEVQFDPTSTPPYNVTYLTTTNTSITGSDVYTVTLLPFTLTILEFTGETSGPVTATISTSTAASTTGSTTDSTTSSTIDITTSSPTSASPTSSSPTTSSPTSANATSTSATPTSSTGPTSTGPTTSSTPAPTPAPSTAAPTAPPSVLKVQIVANLSGDPSTFDTAGYAASLAKSLGIDASNVNVTIVDLGPARKRAELYQVITTVTYVNPDPTQISQIETTSASSVGSTLTASVPPGTTVVSVGAPQSTYTQPPTPAPTPAPSTTHSSASSLSLSFASLALVGLLAILGN